MASDAKKPKETAISPTTTAAPGWIRTFKQVVALSAVISLLFAFDTSAEVVKSLWKGLGGFFQKQWEYVYDKAEGDPTILYFWGVTGAANAVFITACALLTIVDLTGKPAFLLRYKVQEDKNVPLDPKRLRDAIKVAVINQTIIGLPTGWVLFNIGQWRGCEVTRELPTFTRFIVDFVLCVLAEEILFYYSHRLLHHPLVYKYIHKKHHEWTAPIGLIAVYAHPFEHIVSNLVPAFAGPLLTGTHVVTAGVWMVAALTTTTISHSGYHFPFLPSPEAHDYHHLKFNQCYGVLGLMDNLHNTNDQFKASVQFKRHYATLTTTPVNQVYPDPATDRKQA